MNNSLQEFHRELDASMGRRTATTTLDQIFDAYLSSSVADDAAHRTIATDLYRLVQGLM